MVNPQLKKGHTRIANEILEQVMKKALNGTQLRILLFIWRYTYGFQRKDNEFSLTFISEKIEASRSQVDRELKALIDSEIINVLGKGEKGARILSFNKNYEEWGQPESKRKSSLPSNSETIPESEQKLKKKSEATLKYDESNSYFKMAVYFHQKVAAVAKEAGVEHLTKKANLQSWADDFRKLIEIDGVTKKLAKDVMDWVVEDPFWRTNVLSAKKLREKFTDLAIKMNAVKKPQPAKSKVADPRDKDIEFQKWVAAGNDPDDFNWN
ncbi:replication protein [Peribacillus psychrosaccharolyticus]|uniref:replication protein n=1 Tax=Peribacillus psychrosaccharolyticus TaxID=1407 RepID=UPI003D2DD44A